MALLMKYPYTSLAFMNPNYLRVSRQPHIHPQSESLFLSLSTFFFSLLNILINDFSYFGGDFMGLKSLSVHTKRTEETVSFRSLSPSSHPFVMALCILKLIHPVLWYVSIWVRWRASPSLNSRSNSWTSNSFF